MKLKISHQFLQSLFYSLSLIISFGCLSSKALCIETNENVPGIIESLERLQTLNLDRYNKLKNQIISNAKITNTLADAIEIKLDPYYVQSVLFHSENKFYSLIKGDECKFLSLLENDLLKSLDPNNVIANIKDAKGIVQSIIIPKEEFFQAIYKKRCLNNREFRILFNNKNVARTIEGIKFSVPKGEADCKIIHEEWLSNSYTPYLCKIQQVLKTAKSIDQDKITNEQIPIKKAGNLYLTKINLLQRNYIDNLCNNLNDAEGFCANYLKADIWNKVINGEAPNYKLNYRCSNALHLKENITLKDQQNCASKFLSEPKSCITKGNLNYPSYFPMPNCDQISTALNNSKLITDYHDCPGNIDNEAITNLHRIINHFSPRKILPIAEACTAEANYSFARLNLDIKYEKGWPLKICYMNRINKKEQCTTYIPGSRTNEPLSEDQVIAKILYLQKGAPQKTQCQIVSSEKYSPLRSEYKSGCFIVYNPDECTALKCSKKVYWEEKLQADINYIGSPLFEYFPSAFSNERYSVQNLLNEVKSIQSRGIRSLTDIKFFLDKIPSSIIHGVGCAEDLIPDIYSRNIINQCHPLPFIIDGYVTKNNEVFLTTRTAIDDLFSPKLIQWNNIYNSVSAYKELHPLNTWTLYGLKK